MTKKLHPISDLEAKMKPEVLAKARKMAEEKGLKIRLSIVREKSVGKPSEHTSLGTASFSIGD